MTKKPTLQEKLAAAAAKKAGSGVTDSPLSVERDEVAKPEVSTSDVIGKVQQEGLQLPPARKNFRRLPIDQCRPWKKHDRSSYWLTQSKTRKIAESIKEHGQRQLGLVRETKAEDGTTVYEIIFGVRRWFACQLAGVDFSAEFVPAGTTDAQLFEIMDDENDTSEDISDLERYASYYRAIRDGDYTAERLKARKQCGKTTYHKWMNAGSLCEQQVLWDALVPVIQGVSLAAAVALHEQTKHGIKQASLHQIAALPVVEEEELEGKSNDEFLKNVRLAAEARVAQLLPIIQSSELSHDGGTTSKDSQNSPVHKVKRNHLTQHNKTILGSNFNPANGSTRITIEKELVMKLAADPDKLLEHLKEVAEELSVTWKEHGLTS